ncbi:hypothetical protein SDC9_119927 [bioreactor metagenome]|uniref:BclA C-terminal domain-containing protein n=1 Tax=bioreactor metagenome TaxID=1076179 RepID=A0A645C7H7_9ZZZZ
MVFNTTVLDLSPNISYNSATGEFTISQTGNYYVSWWIAVDGAESATTISFGVSLNAGAPIIASSPIVSNQLSGIALISVVAAPAVVTLVNATGFTAFIADTPVQASMIILEVS